jgi:hypothetical protein
MINRGSDFSLSLAEMTLSMSCYRVGATVERGVHGKECEKVEDFNCMVHPGKVVDFFPLTGCPQMILTEAAKRLIKHCRFSTNLSPHTLRAYESDLEDVRLYLGKSRHLDSILAGHLRGYIQYLREQRQLKGRPSGGSSRASNYYVNGVCVSGLCLTIRLKC